MSKDVTFDQARRLCVIGFNRLVNKSYNVSTGEISSHIHVNANALDGAYYSAPTVSDSLDWVRDEKGIECGVYPIMIPIRDGLKRMAYAHSAFDLNNNCKRLQLDISLVKIDTHNLASSALLDAVLTYLEQKEKKIV